MSGQPVRELLVPGLTPEDIRDKASREDVRGLVGQIAILRSGDPVVEVRKKDDMLVLEGGRYGGARLANDGTVLMGVGRAEMTRLVTITGKVQVRGVRFVSAGNDSARNNAKHLVKLGPDAKVAFSDCALVKDRNDPMSAVAADEEGYVAIKNGGKASFNGCVFDGSPGAGLVVANQGAAGNVGIIGCDNRTGSPHAVVTSIFEI